MSLGVLGKVLKRMGGRFGLLSAGSLPYRGKALFWVMKVYCTQNQTGIQHPHYYANGIRPTVLRTACVLRNPYFPVQLILAVTQAQPRRNV